MDSRKQIKRERNTREMEITHRQVFKKKVNVLRVITENTGFMEEGQRNGENQEGKLFKKYLGKFINLTYVPLQKKNKKQMSTLSPAKRMKTIHQH